LWALGENFDEKKGTKSLETVPENHFHGALIIHDTHLLDRCPTSVVMHGKLLFEGIFELRRIFVLL
jgi:hypothetical protein